MFHTSMTNERPEESPWWGVPAALEAEKEAEAAAAEVSRLRKDAPVAHR